MINNTEEQVNPACCGVITKSDECVVGFVFRNKSGHLKVPANPNKKNQLEFKLQLWLLLMEQLRRLSPCPSGK